MGHSSMPFYSIELLRAFFDPQYGNTLKEVIISAFVLEIGWMALLVWSVFAPFERRHILLFTMVPILLGNVLHSVNQFGSGGVSTGTIVLNTVFGLVYSGLYVGAYMAVKPEPTRAARIMPPDGR